VAWGTVPRQSFAVLAGRLREQATSPRVTRGFCATCGTSLTYVHAARSSAIDFTLATLDDPAALRPEMHIWLQDKLPWVCVEDGLPRYQRSKTEAGA
jgi:hypothetical protein